MGVLTCPFLSDRERSSQKASDNASEIHNHAVHSGDKFCPDCAKENPDYNENQATCEDCGENVGTLKEIQDDKVKVCKNCGHNVFESSEKGYTL